MLSEKDYQFMNLALEEARKAFELGNLPVGSVITLDNFVIGKGLNLVDSDSNDLLHAEIKAIQSCTNILFKNKGRVRIYSTLEPCVMCFGAILHYRFSHIYFGAGDNWAGLSNKNILPSYYQNRSCEITGGLLENECSSLLKKYTEAYNCRHHLTQAKRS